MAPRHLHRACLLVRQTAPRCQVRSRRKLCCCRGRCPSRVQRWLSRRPTPHLRHRDLVRRGLQSSRQVRPCCHRRPAQRRSQRSHRDSMRQSCRRSFPRCQRSSLRWHRGLNRRGSQPRRHLLRCRHFRHQVRCQRRDRSSQCRVPHQHRRRSYPYLKFRLRSRCRVRHWYPGCRRSRLCLHQDRRFHCRCRDRPLRRHHPNRCPLRRLHRCRRLRRRRPHLLQSHWHRRQLLRQPHRQRRHHLPNLRCLLPRHPNHPPHRRDRRPQRQLPRRRRQQLLRPQRLFRRRQLRQPRPRRPPDSEPRRQMRPTRRR
jgi:hypothetical protein